MLVLGSEDLTSFNFAFKVNFSQEMMRERASMLGIYTDLRKSMISLLCNFYSELC